MSRKITVNPYTGETLKEPLIVYEDQPLTPEMFYNLETEKIPDEDMVNSPSHYTWLKELVGIEVIDIIRHLDFDLGCAVKYILRQGRKSEKGMSDKEKAVEDLQKAIWYIEDKIKMINKK